MALRYVSPKKRHLLPVTHSLTPKPFQTRDNTVYGKAAPGPKTKKSPTKPASTPTATAIASPIIQCPSINGTTFTATITSSSGATPTTSRGSVAITNTNTPTTKRFLFLCGIDYGEGEAKDIDNVTAKNLGECAEACAKKKGCTGAGWGVTNGEKGLEHKCWMKSDLVKPHNTTADWGFAKLLGWRF